MDNHAGCLGPASDIFQTESFMEPMDAFEPTDRAIELVYYAWRAMTDGADAAMARKGLGRAHHRILFVLARHDGLTVGRLHEVLRISAQALHRPLKRLIAAGLVTAERDPFEHRARILRLSETGAALEREASDSERQVMRQAFDRCGPAAAAAWTSVMTAVAEQMSVQDQQD